MTEDYEWVIGLQASFQPVTTDGESAERIIGEIIEIRDDSPWPDETHYRFVIDTGSRQYDVAKERVDLE